MTEPLEETPFEKKLREVEWEELKPLLKRMTEREAYEKCRMIQNEIDRRIKERESKSVC